MCAPPVTTKRWLCTPSTQSLPKLTPDGLDQEPTEERCASTCPSLRPSRANSSWRCSRATWTAFRSRALSTPRRTRTRQRLISSDRRRLWSTNTTFSKLKTSIGNEERKKLGLKVCLWKANLNMNESIAASKIISRQSKEEAKSFALNRLLI